MRHFGHLLRSASLCIQQIFPKTASVGFCLPTTLQRQFAGGCIGCNQASYRVQTKQTEGTPWRRITSKAANEACNNDRIEVEAIILTVAPPHLRRVPNGLVLTIFTLPPYISFTCHVSRNTCSTHFHPAANPFGQATSRGH
jgi:hypothetical protein